MLNIFKNSYIKSAYYSICDDYGANADEIWMNRNWFCTTAYCKFGDGGKATQSSPSENITRYIVTQSKDFTIKGIGKVSRSLKVYVYLVPAFQV